MLKATDPYALGAVRRRRLLASGAAAMVLGACRPSAAQPLDGISLRVLSPKVQGTAAFNLKKPAGRPEPSYTYAIADDDARVKAERIPFVAQTEGLNSLEVRLHGRPVAQFVPGPDGRVDGWLDLSKEARGPLVVEVFASDGPPGSSRFDVLLKMRFHLFVVDGRDRSPGPERAPGHPAHGRALLFEDQFRELSAGRVAGAAAGKRWFTNKPGGGDFGDAAFERVEGPRNPFYVEDGFLRIRAQYDKTYDDPYGYKRPWYSGNLASAFNDGSASFAVARGYFEIRMMIPNGAGVWPGFWLLPVRAIRNGEGRDIVEVDILEAYGFPSTYNTTVHLWNGNPKREQAAVITPSTATNYNLREPDRGDLTWEFHEFGVDLTGSEYVFYCDGRVVKRMPAFKSAPPDDQYYVLVTLALGSGWPTPVPPGGRHDLWIDHVRVYAPRS